MTDFCQPLQTGELDAVSFLEQELNNGSLFILYILFHFRSATLIVENSGNKMFKMQYKNCPTLR